MESSVLIDAELVGAHTESIYSYEEEFRLDYDANHKNDKSHH